MSRWLYRRVHSPHKNQCYTIRNCCSSSRKCCVHVRFLATVGTAMQVAAFIGEIVCTALPAISVLSQCSTPAPSASVCQYMISLALSYSSNNVQTWLFPWTLNHRTLTCLLLQPGSTGLFVPACMCAFDPLSWSCGRRKLKFVRCEDRPTPI